jgi:MFS family permease
VSGPGSSEDRNAAEGAAEATALKSERWLSPGVVGVGAASLFSDSSQVAVLRAFAWVSRGIRSPSRDMLLTSLVTKKTYGRAFGIERAGDNAGAILGPVLASLLVGLVGLRYAILLSIVPGLLTAISITLAAREARRGIGQTPVRRTLQLQLRRLRHAGLGRVLIPIACFEPGNVATTLLILRATGLLSSGGRDIATATSVAILLYAAHNAMAAVASPVAGHLCDRRSPWLVFVLGAVAYAVGYAVFAVGLQGWPLLPAGFLLAGLGIGFAETAESTLVAQAAGRAAWQRVRRPRSHPGPRRPRVYHRGRHPVGRHLTDGRVRLRRRLDGRRHDQRNAAEATPTTARN